MPYSKEHKQRSKDKILESAVALFCHQGFENVSIDDLMEHAAMTRGAFYAHFKSKADVYNQAITAASRNVTLIIDQPEVLKKEKLLAYFIDAYLSLRHVNQQCSPCPLAFLASDVTTGDEKVKQTYTLVFQGFLNNVSRNLPDKFNAGEKRQLSHNIAVLMIGSVVIARALEDEELQIQLLESSKQTAFSLAGVKNIDESLRWPQV